MTAICFVFIDSFIKSFISQPNHDLLLAIYNLGGRRHDPSEVHVMGQALVDKMSHQKF